MEDIISAAMYFNTITSKNKLDSYLDRLHQIQALVQIYLDLWNRSRSAGTPVRLLKDVKVTEVQTWLKARADMLADGQNFSTCGHMVTIGVIVRLGLMIPPEITEWFLKQETSKTREGKLHYSAATMKAIVNQGTLSTAHIWSENKTPRSVRVCASLCLFVLPPLFC